MERNESMQELLHQSDKMMKGLRKGDIITGTIGKVSDNEVVVHLQYMFDGVVPKEEFSVEEQSILAEKYQTGQNIQVYVIKVQHDEGLVLLSKKRADQVINWKEIEISYQKGETVDAHVEKVVKGGVVASVKGLSAFIPLSQLSIAYVQNAETYIGKTLSAKVIEFDPKNQKIVLSSKVIEAEAHQKQKEQLWRELQIGEKRNGKVTKLMKYGAFVDIGGIEGLVHLSDMAWRRVHRPEEVVQVGDNVEVYIVDIDKQKEKVALGLKDVTQNPWLNVVSKYKVDETYEGKVTRLLDKGAIIELEPAIEGFVHISEITEDRIAKPSDKLEKGQVVKVKILDIKQKEEKISLSIKEAKQTADEDYSEYNKDKDMGTLGDLFKDALKNIKF